MKKTFKGSGNEVALEVLDYIREKGYSYNDMDVIVEIIENNN